MKEDMVLWPELRSKSIRLIPGKALCLVAGKKVALTHTEFRLLYVLMRRAGWIFTREMLLVELYGDESARCVGAISQFIFHIRRALGGRGLIESVRGSGYRFTQKVTKGEVVHES